MNGQIPSYNMKRRHEVVLVHSLNGGIPTLIVLICNLILFLNGRVVVQADGRRPVIVEAWAQAQAILCEICGEQSGTGTYLCLLH